MSVYLASNAQIMSALGLPADTLLTIDGLPEMYGLSDSTLAGFSGGFLSPYLVVSSGDIADVVTANTAGSQGRDLGAYGVPDDTVTLTFQISVPLNAASFSFDFTFLSEEYPEYVGSQYNDFLSVLLNGTQIALDTSGNSISVNNDFFSDTLVPVGTMFDGQTPPLRIVAPVEQGLSQITLTISIGDVGDGIYDSAAFLSSFEFLEPQVVFVDFDGGSIDWESLLMDKEISLPSAGLTDVEESTILSSLNALFGDFLIDFVGELPTVGEFSTILVGGSPADLPDWFGAKATLRGQAERIDYGNEHRDDDAFVLSASLGDIGRITQVLAHEMGHLLGLRHIADATQLMYPFVDPTRTLIGGESPLAEIVDGIVTPVGGVQDSYSELVRNLGLRESSKIVVEESAFSSILKFFSFDFKSASSLYNGVLAVVNEEGIIISVSDLGTVRKNSTVEFSAPLTDTDQIVMFGASTEGGAVDTFVGGKSAPKKFNLNSAGEEGLIDKFGLAIGDIEKGGLTVAEAGKGGKLDTIGSIKTETIDLGANGATDGDDVIVGTEETDTLVGLAGGDELYGLGKRDKLFGGLGDDMLDGGVGNDVLRGSDGSDTLFGGLGADVLFGDSGDDVYLFTSAAETKATVKGRDIIADFVKGQDIIDLSAIDAILATTDDDAFDLVAGGRLNGEAGRLVTKALKDAVLVQGDIDGDGKADFSLTVMGKMALGEADFLL